MKTKILITGNGFDLAQGLPTRYDNFIETLNIISKTESNLLGNKYDDYFKSNHKVENIKNIELFDKEKISSLKLNLNNVWYNYFRYELEIDTWIDFESKLEETLQKIDYYINLFKKQIFNKDAHYDLKFGTIEELGDNSADHYLLEDFKIIKLLREYGNDTFQINETYCRFNSRSNCYTSFKEDEFYEFLIKEWELFIKLFNDYLITFVKPFLNYISVDKLIYLDIHYTFNYTNTYEKIIHPKTPTKHLHGKISDDHTNNNIVLGFDHTKYDSQVPKMLLPFTKGQQRLNKDTDFKFISNIPDHFRDLKIYIYGHSLNISDKKFLQEIIDLLQGKYERKYASLVVYYNSNKEPLLNNLCSIFSIETIHDLMVDGKITFIKYSNEAFFNEFRVVPMSTLQNN